MQMQPSKIKLWGKWRRMDVQLHDRRVSAHDHCCMPQASTAALSHDKGLAGISHSPAILHFKKNPTDVVLSAAQCWTAWLTFRKAFSPMLTVVLLINAEGLVICRLSFM